MTSTAHTDTYTHKHLYTHTLTHTHTDTHTHWHTHWHTLTLTHTHTHTHTLTHTHTHTHRHTTYWVWERPESNADPTRQLLCDKALPHWMLKPCCCMSQTDFGWWSKTVSTVKEHELNNLGPKTAQILRMSKIYPQHLVEFRPQRKQRCNNTTWTLRQTGKGYNPEFPVLQCTVLDIFLKHLFHLVHSLPGHGNARLWELGLHHTGTATT